MGVVTRSRNRVRTGRPLLAASLVLGLATLSIFVLPTQVASAASQTVTNCNDSGTGSLRQAVLNATAGSTVTFALSPACSTITLTSGDINISENLTVVGPGADVLAVSGNEESNVFVIAGGSVAISGLTLENGDIPGNFDSVGGGIYNNGTLTLSDVTLVDNTAQQFGGAIYNGSGANLTVADSTLVDNGGAVASGGAIYSEGDVTVTGSSLLDNSADDGGGILNQTGTVTVSGSTISDNSSGGYGGGIDNYGPVSLTDSTVSGNSGGGVTGGSVDVSDSTVADNTGSAGVSAGGPSTIVDSTVADNNDGGVSFGGTLDLTNSTLWGNSASGSPGGGISGSGTLDISATMVADSPAGGDCFLRQATVNDGGYNLDDDGSCGFTASTDHSDTSAGLDPTGLESNGGPTETIALQPGSPAIGAVNSAALCSTPDQRGVVRPTPCDIGAYQSHFRTVTNCNDSGAGSLRQAVANALFGDSIDFKLSPSCSTIALGSTLDIGATVAIDGPGADALAVSGGGTHEVMAVAADETATVSGLTVEDGQSASSDGGGGVLNQGTLTVTFSTLTDNVASALGGGLSNLGSLTVVNSTVSDDTTGTGSGLSGLNGGGGIFNDGLLAVENSTISGDSTAHGANPSDGGGIANDGGFVDVTGSTLSADHAPGVVSGSATGNGGALWSDNGDLAIGNSTISGNSASDDGGGIDDAGGGIATLVESTLSGNSASAAGGGLENDGSIWLLTASTASGNSARQGGGIDSSGDLEVTTSTLSGNVANGGQGGGVANAGLFYLSMSTVSGDTAAAAMGGGIANANGATASLAGTIVATSSPGRDCSGVITDAGYNLDDDSTCGFSEAEHSQSGLGPELGPLAANGGPTETQIPAYNSPVFGQIPYGTTENGLQLCPGTDQRGIARPQGTQCDLGAVEVPLGTQSITFTSTPPTNVVEGGPTYTASATGGGSGNPVTFSTADSESNPCTVTGSVYSFVRPGQCEVIANQAGNASYRPASPNFQTINVTAAPPTITKVKPAKGKVGRKVTIVGNDLLGASPVSFDGTEATVLSNTQTSITVKVPKGASTGKISVTTPGGTVTSAKVFTVK